jgi:hypothetical protein
VKANIRTSMVSIAIATLTFSAVIDAQAQNTDTPRKPIAESAIALPEYYGHYVVQSNGRLDEIKQTNRELSPNAAPSLTIDSDCEFLMFAKRDEKTGDDYLDLYKVPWPGQGFVMTFTPEGSSRCVLREKPVAGQPEMSRFIPQHILAPGVYHLRIGLEWYRFVVGPMPAQAPSQQTKAEADQFPNDAKQLLVGTWRYEGGVRTYQADGTWNAKIDSAIWKGVMSGTWSMDGDILTDLCTEQIRDGSQKVVKLKQPQIYQRKVLKISDSIFFMKDLGRANAEWHGTKVK